MVWRWMLLLLGVWMHSAHAAETPPVRLGLIVPAASEAGRVAQSMRSAADMAASDWSERLGRRIEFSVHEDQFDPRQAALTAQQLVREGVWGVVGHFYSSSSIPASEVYRQAGLPMVTATSTHPRLTSRGFENVFRVSGRDDQQAKTAADFLLSRLAPRRIAIVHDRTEYGRTLADVLRSEVKRRAPRRLAAEETLMQGDTAFAGQVDRLKAARSDAVYFGGIYREAGSLLRQMRGAGLRATFVSCDAVLDAEFVTLAGEDAAAGSYLTFAPDPRLLDAARDVIRRYEARYGSLGPYVLYVYDAVGVLLRAIQTARPLDGSPAELRKVARTIHGMTYRGSLGPFRWDGSGDLTASPYVMYATKRGGAVQGWFEQLPPPTGGGRPTPNVTGRPR
jgi:branched-chain amino acid transport system substrate-binding protein